MTGQKKSGLVAEAHVLEYEWKSIAAILNVKEDYHGFYERKFLPVIRRTIDDMLTETAPYRFSEADLSGGEFQPEVSTPVQLLNAAWNKFPEKAEEYPEWERPVISAFLSGWFFSARACRG